MTITSLSLIEQAMFVIAALVLFASFVLLAQARLVAAVHAFAWQGAMIATATALVAAAYEEHHLYISALLTFVLKALLIPWMLHRLIRKLSLRKHIDELAHPTLVILAGTGLVVFAYWVALPIERLELSSTRNILAISLAVVLLGLLMMVAKQQAVAQVLGFMSMENGLFLAAVAATHGMPLIVELGVAFDVLVAMVLFGVFFFQMRDSIDSLNVDHLNLLNEWEEEDS